MNRWIPGALIAGALGAIMWAGGEQVQVQGRMNAEMVSVLTDLQEARRLTGVTAESLEPLRPTAEAIDAMNGQLRALVSDVRAMNGSLERITASQRRILTGVAGLSGKTAEVVRLLGAIEQSNRGLYDTTAAMEGQAGAQVDKLGQLARMTDSATGELRELNGKFQFLRRLP